MSERNITISLADRLAMLAREHPDGEALTFIPVTDGARSASLTWHQVERVAHAYTLALRHAGADAGTLVIIDLPHGLRHVAAAYGAWKLGATVLPLNTAAPESERNATLQAASKYRPLVTVSTAADAIGRQNVFDDDGSADSWGSSPIPQPGHLIASGGSTGHPKLIDSGIPGALQLLDGHPAEGEGLASAGIRQGQIHLICTPLHHTSGFAWLHRFLMLGNHVILLEQFNPDLFLNTVERCQVNHTILVPATMQRLAARPDIGQRNLSTLEAVWHGGAVCPPGLKRQWIELVGATHLWEAFGGTEANGSSIIRGDEWLAHPGSVGRPTAYEVRVVDAEGRSLPPGEIGELYFRSLDRTAPQFQYIGPDRARITADGFSSVGDLGWLDQEGYLYATDRRTDMIITGGSNVFAAEVEAVLLDCPKILDAVVIGLPDESWGRRVHALCVPTHPADPPTGAELNAWCRAHLATYKVPKAFEMVEVIPRSDAGKINRQDLIDQRLDAATDRIRRTCDDVS